MDSAIATPPANGWAARPWVSHACRGQPSGEIGHDRRVPDAPAVSRLLPRDRDPALETVVAAFAVDPLLRWVWPEDQRYADCAVGFFGLLLDLRMELGEAWGADGTAAVAMWDPPGGLYLPVPEERWRSAQGAFTEVERGRWAAFEEVMAIPPDAGPHWYLGVLATAPDRQRRGLGRAVLAPMLASADRTRHPTYLETMSAANVAFYARLGFATVTEARPADGPQCWLLRRDPQETR
jgi:GNAT superfamily N-acetyltransferase